MKRWKRIWQFSFEKYRLLTAKKYTTVAGTLVFFLLMSIVPIAFWAVLLFGKMPVHSQKVFSLSVFSSVAPIFERIRTEAETATTGASVFLILTSLYSATSLFYQMRKSGEIIYGSSHERQGWKMRLGAVALLFCVMTVVIFTLLVFAMLTLLIARFLTGVLEQIIQYLLLLVLSFLLVLLLNAYVCPHRVSLKKFFGGTLLTLTFWLAAILGFAVYLRIANVNRLYGAFSTLIVFMLWLYVMMIGFVVGVIWNSEGIVKHRGRPREGKICRAKSRRAQDFNKLKKEYDKKF